MARTKNIKVDMPLLESIATILNTRFEMSERALSSDLKEFIKELRPLDKDKYYTQGRATKISVAITVYYSINEFKMEGEILRLLSLFEDGIESDTAKVFAQSAQAVLTLLDNYPKRTFMDAELYFIDEKGSKELAKIAKNLKSSFNNESDERPYGINRIVNQVNSTEVCHKYSVFYTPRFKQINLEDSVEKYQPGHYGVWKNNLIKEHHDYIDTHKPDDVTISRMQYALEAKLLAAKEEDEYMEKHRDELEIRIIGYKHAELRPVIKIMTKEKLMVKGKPKGNTNDKHLRSGVPNTLWFSSAPFRSDMDADEFILSAQNPYGDVYYKVKK